MYFETDKNDHGLPHNPFKSCVVPRPIGWISTVSAGGLDNLAPFSQFISLSYDPPFVLFSSGGHPDGGRSKDTVINAEATGEFVYNMSTHALRQAVAKSAEHVAPDIDEFDYAGLGKLDSRLVAPKRVAESPIHFECKVHDKITLPANDPAGRHEAVIGQVLAIHIGDEFLTDEGRVDILKIRPLARMGYLDYTSVTEIFQIEGAEAHPGMIGDITRPTAAE